MTDTPASDTALVERPILFMDEKGNITTTDGQAVKRMFEEIPEARVGSKLLPLVPAARVSVMQAELARVTAERDKHREAIEFAHAGGFSWPSDPLAERDREIAWMIERKYPVNSIGATEPRWYAERDNGDHWWTANPHEGKRFATKAEADAYPAYRMIASDPAISLTEHVWINDSFSWSHGRAEAAIARAGEPVAEVRKRLQWISEARWDEDADLDSICTFADQALLFLGNIMSALVSPSDREAVGMVQEETRGNFVAVTTDEPQIGNWHTAIYEDDYKGLLIALCNQNGRYPWQVRAILAGLNAKREAMDALAASPSQTKGAEQ
ncbi:MAG: hypothetical protein EOS79_11475 [Mesorhizobium sp.]|nr:MAG: hypothetical protein EOS79_11475 [Mesorhizobium sp.]